MNETENNNMITPKDDYERDRFPYCVVWTPIPLLTWLFPFIGHTGICYSNGVIRDFAGPYYVSEDNMAFGRPTRILRLNKDKVKGKPPMSWDNAVLEASEVYKGRMHNLCCDNCHSHVCTALDAMEYDGKKNWNMVTLCFWIFFCAEYVSFGRFLWQWVPFLIIVSIIAVLVVFT